MSFSDSYKELSSELGACPIESGVIGKLADHECEHGRLAGDSTPPCGCWHERPRPIAVTPEDVTELDDLLERQAA